MGFPENVKLRALIACRRQCVLCGKFCGTHMELHHIKQHADGGGDTFENCIPLCLDCHADVKTYNPHHPKGTKYSEAELIERRDIFYKEIEDGRRTSISKALAEHFEETQTILRKLFREEKDAIGAVQGYKRALYSYGDLREKVPNCTPEQVDEIVKWLSEHRYVATDIRKDFLGVIGGSIKITQEGLAFYYDSKE